MKGKIARRLARYVSRRDVALSHPSGCVTFTFDDAYSAACTLGAQIIEREGGRATYYVCGGLDRSVTGDPKYHNADELRQLHSDGHEIACHGFGHLNYQETSSDRIERDLDLNASYFVDNGLNAARNFAYPFGCVSPRVKEISAKRFRSSRGVQAELNRGRVDLTLLKSVPLYASSLDIKSLAALIQQTRASASWLIFFSHDVSENPGYFDVTPPMLKFAADQARQCGLPMLTLQAALDYHSAPTGT